MLRFIVSLVLLLLTLLAGILYERGNPLAYVGVMPLMIQLLVPLFATLAVWRLGEIGSAFKDAFSTRESSPSRVRSARIWEFAEKICYATSVIVLILAAVLILGRVSAAVGGLPSALAVALTGPLYGLLLAIIFRILKARVER